MEARGTFLPHGFWVIQVVIIISVVIILEDYQLQYLPKIIFQKRMNAFLSPKLIDETTRWSECKAQNQSIYDFQVETLEGEFTDLSQYKGQVLLVINVATFCAYTQQYTDFNPLIEKNRENGKEFTILGFPCNQFYLQEPAENHELLNGIVHVRPGNGWHPHRNLHIYVFEGQLPSNCSANR
uniref:Glutathione peroxidase n=1 Tax=Ditylenchus dipsaci TaxID=166011 RepID=A0A915DAB6_9BILA